MKDTFSSAELTALRNDQIHDVPIDSREAAELLQFLFRLTLCMQSKYRCGKGRTYRCVVAVASSLRIRLRTCRWSVMSLGHSA